MILALFLCARHMLNGLWTERIRLWPCACVSACDSVDQLCILSMMLQVANEEQKHYVMMDELIQFVAKAEPGSGRWAESAEYNRLDDELYDGYKY